MRLRPGIHAGRFERLTVGAHFFARIGGHKRIDFVAESDLGYRSGKAQHGNEKEPSQCTHDNISVACVDTLVHKPKSRQGDARLMCVYAPNRVISVREAWRHVEHIHQASVESIDGPFSFWACDLLATPLATLRVTTLSRFQCIAGRFWDFCRQAYKIQSRSRFDCFRDSAAFAR
ncbi:hypothetical protein GCM10027034_17720 [Ramlibacter solisilvae]|uniref:hypothetical protein n=1 Tax=Ramlibacter tataouinensis TaxID=94132 RepID=UPI001D10F6CE|nr:hypothetical protein [Ramlibacter tataouinensis]